MDDNETNRRLLERQLVAWGVRHDEAPSGAVALEKLRAAADHDPFDIAILDMQMPEMDGATLGRTIRNDGAISDVRLVMLTSIGFRGDGARAKAMGFAAYLSKPVKQSVLHDCLATIVGQKTHQEESDSPLVTRHNVGKSSRQQVRILLAEDNETNQIVALKTLEKLGCRADAVSNGLEVIAALQTAPYDVVLMDIQMPEMDGSEATRRIRAHEAAVLNPAIPIIAMTANVMEGDRERYIEEGMDDYVSKPVSPRELATALERQLQRITERSGPASPLNETSEEEVQEQAGTLRGKPAFDGSVLTERFEGDQEVVTTVLRVFMADAPKQIELLKEALEAKDADALRRQAHTLKGAAGNVGAPALEDLSIQAENAGDKGDLEAAAAAVRTMDRAFEELKTALAA